MLLAALSFAMVAIAPPVQAAPLCAQRLLETTTLTSALDVLRTYHPFVLKQMPPETCVPKTIQHIGLGAPLCMLAGDVPAQAMGLTGLAENNKLIDVSYLAPYSPASHARLFAWLRSAYREVPRAQYPEHFKSTPVHRELTALFQSDGAYVVLGKPSDGMPGEWHSSVGFVDMSSIDIVDRNINDCP
jgi:hypothetical protein